MGLAPAFKSWQSLRDVGLHFLMAFCASNKDADLQHMPPLQGSWKL